MKTNYRSFANLILFIFLPYLSFGQHDIPIGTWRNHLSYQNLNKLLFLDNKIFAAGNFALFYFDLEDNSVNTLSKINGFADAEVTTMAYNAASGTMIIGYGNGSVDLVRNQIIINNHDIRDAPIEGSKKINHITIFGQSAFFSTDFGLVVFDIGRVSIKEIYGNLGEGGVPIPIFSSIVFHDSLFLASESGLMAGSLQENVNLMDHLNWRRYTEEDGVPEGAIRHLAVLNNVLYAGIDFHGLYFWDQKRWQPTSLSSNSAFNSLSVSGNQMLAALENELFVIENKDTYTKVDDHLIKKPGNASFDAAGNLWIADQVYGLVSNKEGGFRSFSPRGPLRNDITKLFYLNSKLIGLPGGLTTSFEPKNTEGSIYIFEDGTWNNYATSLQNLPPVHDFMDAAYHAPSEKFYFASFGNGILEWDKQGQYTLINHQTSGSTLQPADGTNSTFVTGIAIDNQNGLWATNFGVNPSLHRFFPESSWNGFGLGILNSQYPLGITIADNSDKWIILRSQSGAEILVFNEISNTHRVLRSEANSGAITGNIVNKIVQDKEGFMWIGTDRGLFYIMGAQSVLNNEPVNAVVPRHEGSFLLRGENVTAIKVDGGNRKWVGTTNGLWLIDDLGENIIQNFTTRNSPLPSNHLLDLEIDEKSGEVFIATDKGLISYRSTATKAQRAHQNVKIFPNPVKGDFTGQLGITGLSYNAIVKITDMGGRLVRQIYANGGTAVWDVNDNKGNRVKSGIYLVLSASEDGQETFMGKIAVIE